MLLNEMPVIESDGFTNETLAIPKRRNKSKRIQKKWSKKYGFNYILIPKGSETYDQ